MINQFLFGGQIMFLRNLMLMLIGTTCFVLNHNAIAACASVLRDGDFESQRSNVVSQPWVAVGKAGIDVNRRQSYSGRNNAWARNNTGWNGISQSVRLYEGQTYTVKAYVRSSSNNDQGYIGFSDANLNMLVQTRFRSLPAYQEIQAQFRPNETGTYNVFAHFWAPDQDASIKIDKVRVDSPCEDVILKPADEQSSP
jgi:hypothetical protein